MNLSYTYYLRIIYLFLVTLKGCQNVFNSKLNGQGFFHIFRQGEDCFDRLYYIND